MMIFLMTLFVFCLVSPAQGQTQDTFSVLLPEDIYAMAGSCVLIPCTFNVSEFETKLETSRSINAMWIKGGPHINSNVVFNSTKNTTMEFERIEILGKLRVRNCTTVFYNIRMDHASKYHFRIEMDSSTVFRVTFPKSFHLTVKDSPVSPHVSEMSEVSEGSSVSLTCTAAAPCPSQPPTITWSLPTGNVHTQIRDEKDGTKSLLSCLTFTTSRSHHDKEISCMASYRRQNQSTVAANSNVQILRVLFSPEDVGASVSPSGPVPEGSSVTLTCNSSEANPPVQNYTWLRGEQHTPIGSGQTLTFNLSSSDEGLYYCRAEHPQGAKESAAVRLLIEEQKKSEHFLFLAAAGGCLGGLLLCVLIGFALRMRKIQVPQRDEQRSLDQDSGACVSGACKDGSVHTDTPKASEDQQEEIHYGEISFSKPPINDSSERTWQDCGQDQGTEYAEVHLSGRHAAARYQKAPDTEELYAQVKRK